METLLKPNNLFYVHSVAHWNLSKKTFLLCRLNETYFKAGGLLQMYSSKEVGRNLHQIYNIKSSQGCTSSLTSKCDKDLVYDLLEQHYVSGKDFVRNVNFAESVMSVVGTNQQFEDIVRFCADENMAYEVFLESTQPLILGTFL